jgi:hypothetical protein
MATVIDALVVSLGLDSSKFMQGQKESTEVLKKFGDQSEKTNKKAIDDTKKLGENFDKVKNAVIGLAAVVIGFNGLKDFVSSMVTSNAALGRNSAMLNMSARDLDAWGAAIETVGGTAQGFQQSMQNIEGGLQKFRMGMGGEETVTALARLGVQAKNGTVSMTDLSAALVRVKNAQGAQAAMALGQQLGLDQGTFQLLLQGPQAVQALHDKMYALSGVNEENTKAAQRLQAAWAQLKQASSGIANSMFGTLTPALEWVAAKLTAVSNWARDNKDFVTGFFIGLAAAIGAVVIATLPITGTILAITAAIAAASIAVGALYADWMRWTNGGKSALGDLWNYFRDVIKLIVTLFTGSGRQISAAWGKVWTDCKQLFTDFLSWVKGSAPTLGEAIKNAFAKAFDWVKGRARAIWDAITGKQSAGDVDAPETSDKQPGDGAKSSQPTSGGKSAVMASALQAAKAAQDKYGIPASVTLAQFALESGNGAHMPAGSNNPFGIKAKAGQPYVEAQTNEFINGKMERVTQKFAKFDSLSDAFDAHAKLLATSPAYASARSHENDPKAFANALTGTYATDPQYGAKLNSIMASNSGMVGAGMNGGAQAPSTTTVQTNIGSVNVQTAATDANGIARDMHKSLSNNSLISSGTYGVA